MAQRQRMIYGSSWRTKSDSFFVVRSYGRALVALLPLLFIYWSVPYESATGGLLAVSNAILPFYFVMVTGYLGFRMARLVEGSIWTPLVWFPVQSAVFYGFGPLVRAYGNEVTQIILANHYLSISPQELFRAHQLSVTGIFMVLLGIFLHAILRAKVWKSPRTNDRPLFNPFKLGLFFVVTGGCFRYLVLKPAQWDLIDILIPGVLSNLGQIVDLGFAIVAFCAAVGNKKARLVMLTLFPLHVFLTTLSFSKMEIVIALLLPALASFVAHRNTRKLFVQLGLIVAAYMVLQDYVHYGRAQVYERTGTISQAGYVERVGHLVDYFGAFAVEVDQDYEQEGEKQGWWTRLDFSGVQVHAMDRYDNGFANPQLHEAWIRFVPRAIWPEKPILYGPGLELYRLLSSNEDGYSFLGLSIYGDLYWQYGWTGVFIGGLMVGWFLAILITRSLVAIRRQEFLMMPFVLMSLQVGLLGPNKYIIVGFIGQIPILLFYYLLISGVIAVLKRQHKVHTHHRVSEGDLSLANGKAGSGS